MFAPGRTIRRASEDMFHNAARRAARSLPLGRARYSEYVITYGRLVRTGAPAGAQTQALFDVRGHVRGTEDRQFAVYRHMLNKRIVKRFVEAFPQRLQIGVEDRVRQTEDEKQPVRCEVLNDPWPS